MEYTLYFRNGLVLADADGYSEYDYTPWNWRKFDNKWYLVINITDASKEKREKALECLLDDGGWIYVSLESFKDNPDVMYWQMDPSEKITSEKYCVYAALGLWNSARSITYGREQIRSTRDSSREGKYAWSCLRKAYTYKLNEWLDQYVRALTKEAFDTMNLKQMAIELFDHMDQVDRRFESYTDWELYSPSQDEAVERAGSKEELLKQYEDHIWGNITKYLRKYHQITKTELIATHPGVLK